MKQQSGQRAKEVLGDSGYCLEENLRKATKKKADLYIATGKQKHNQPAPESPRGRLPKLDTLVDWMKRKPMTRAGRAIYARRMTIVEPVFGQIKQAPGFPNSCCTVRRKCVRSGRWYVPRATCSSSTGPARLEKALIQAAKRWNRSSQTSKPPTQRLETARRPTPLTHSPHTAEPYSDALLEPCRARQGFVLERKEKMV